ncbi:MAG: hypothetical protein EHM47_17210 [Ignavibacteriales bacterium]|nr:MAG: hypothetical protein EHM47_17210 [Ignavibacteriales bacterium]
MKKLFIALPVIILFIAGFLVQDNTKLPKGWFAAGSNPSEYEVGIDNSLFQDGKSSAYIKSKKPKTNEFGTLMQYIDAGNYVEKRLRLSGYIKSDAVEGWSSMWMRIDGDMGKQLGFDNMRGRTIHGTTDWKKYEIVLDVPSGSVGIAFGVILGGKGKVWFDNMKLEVVNNSVPVTNLVKEPDYPKMPVNLNMEE